MKKIHKFLTALTFIFLISVFFNTTSHSHGFMSVISIFSSAMATEQTAEKEVIKELKIKIYNLDSEPKKRSLLQSDKSFIRDLKDQLNELQKKTSIDELRTEIEKEIEALGGKPITKVTEIDRDEQIVALRKQLENLKIIKAETDAAKNQKETAKLKALKKEIEDKIIALGEEPITKKMKLKLTKSLKPYKIN